ncbi:MAG: Lar family restriction alleviation protein [Candidatus Nanopelagicales bacterium]
MKDPTPCPFCGSTDLEIRAANRPYSYVTCLSCECDGPPGEDAMAEWNTRPRYAALWLRHQGLTGQHRALLDGLAATAEELS